MFKALTNTTYHSLNSLSSLQMFMSIFVMSLAYEHDPQILKCSILLGTQSQIGGLQAKRAFFLKQKQTAKTRNRVPRFLIFFQLTLFINFSLKYAFPRCIFFLFSNSFLLVQPNNCFSTTKKLFKYN